MLIIWFASPSRFSFGGLLRAIFISFSVVFTFSESYNFIDILSTQFPMILDSFKHVLHFKV